MILQDINKQLDKLYSTTQCADHISIGTRFTVEGDPVNFLFYQDGSKYCSIVTNRNFSEWIACSTNGWRKAAPLIEKAVKPYGVQWDNEEGRLYIRFRRNEMTVAQALLCLQQAVYVICEIEFN